MSGAPDLHVPDLADLAESYDAGALERGLAYYTDGRVRLISVTPGLISSVVAGSGRNTYVVRITWSDHAGEVILDDTCSCPLGGYCKHAVATVLAARGEMAEAAGPSRNSSWRSALDGLLDDDEPTGHRATAPLALQFHLTRPRTTWAGSAAQVHLSVRPVRMGKRDKWIKTGASWRDLAYVTGDAGFPPGQVAALRALWNASPRHSYYPDTGPMSLTRYGPELWIHLRNVAEAGVSFVDESGEPLITVVDEPARVEVDLTGGHDGDVELTTTLVLGTVRLGPDIDDLGLLGSPPHGVFAEGGDGTILLGRFERPLTPAVQRLLVTPPLSVPDDEVDELLDVYQPVLARHAHVGSSDGSVTVTTRRFDGLTLFVERHRVDVATTGWHARYVRGETTSRYPLGEPGGTRDYEAEAEAVAALGARDLPEVAGRLVTGARGTLRGTTVRGADTVKLFTEVLPWLADAGVEVLVEDVGPITVPDLREATADPLVELAVSDAETGEDRTDWFDLTVSVSVDGETVPFAALFTALNLDEPVLVLPSGTWLRLDRPEFDRLRDLITEARGLVESDGGADGDTIRINPFQISWFEELAALGVVAEQSERWTANMTRLRSLAEPGPVAVPDTLEAELRPYQTEGFAWLSFLSDNDLGGILADDMGLGKTVQILALCAAIRRERPDARFLVVAPTSVVDNWRREANRFVPSLPVVTVTETHKRRGSPLTEAVGDAALVVTSYTLFRLEYDHYAALGWDLLLLDEAQFVKNHRGKTYKSVRQLPARTKIAITGTPLENSLMDLWSLLSIVAPGLYPDPDAFSRVYRKPIEKGEAPELLATLRRRIAPLMRRRTKDAVLTELPPKIEQIVEVDLSPRHRRLYQTRLQRERAKVLGLVDDVQRNRFVIFKSLTLLRQLSLDPGLVDEADDHIGSAKLDRLVDDITQVVAEGHRALVFSQFTRFLRRAEARLGDAGVASTYLDGRTRRRAEVIDTFKSGEVPVFLISLKAGGVGLNLAEADYCFILDPWWNPATESQAVDRAHRIGQVNPVVVYRYVSTGTIEEKVMELKARKAALFADVVDADGAMSGALTAEDIRGLFTDD